jgi:prolyl-tRNA synthetase
MKWSEFYIPTLRDDPAEAEIASHRLLMRAGYIRKLAAGVYNYLPLMQRVLLKITQIVREEMDAAGAVEILMPVLHPAELWQQSGRWKTVGKELMRAKDRHERDLVLGGTHEEIVTNLIKGELKSYRQIPLNLYQIQTKFRDEIRPRFGLMRGREFIMKDAYTFDKDEEGLKVSYKKMLDAYKRTFDRCGLETKMVESDTGAMGGTAAHEFMVMVDTEGGENVIFCCDECGYAANMDKASSLEIEKHTDEKESPKPIQKVATPEAKTVEEVTSFLKVPAQKLAKTLLYKADDQIIAAMIRGNRQINEIKLKNTIGCINLEMADAGTVEKITGAQVGFAGPVGLKGVKIIADEEVSHQRNFVTGANENDHHFINVNIGRDLEIEQVAEIRCAQEGEMCPRCKEEPLSVSRGIEVGNTFMLGTKYSKALGATFSDIDGQEKLFIMGSYGIGITRTAQAAVERFHDEKGIIWPAPIAPFEVEVLPLNVADEKQREAAFQIYEELKDQGLEVLLDDRDERAGVKFNDADLIGLPLRVNVGAKSLKENKMELYIRKTKEIRLVVREVVVEKCKELLGRL